ncbi:MAG: glycosyltransferase family 9 protein [Thermoanaerobaculia bacterium]
MRILILKTSALGDVVHALPVLTELRRRLPDARIGWVVEEAFAPLLEGRPDLDAVIPVRTRIWRRPAAWGQAVGEIVRFVRALQAFSPDVALDLMGNHKGGFLAALTLADRRVGLARPFRREPSSALWINQPVTPAGVHAVERNLATLQALGIEAGTIDFGGERLFPEPPAPEETEGFILLHPGAGWGNKRYPPADWAAVARLLGERLGLPTAVACAPGEEALAEAVAAASDGHARIESLPTLDRLAHRLRQARLVLAGDTGPLHLAHALGTPVLAVMGPTDPARHGPYGSPERAIFHRLPCSFCYKRFDETKACLFEVRPEAIVERALTLL